jgi:hypothetical protein
LVEPSAFLEGFLKTTLHVESSFGIFVTSACKEGTETINRFLEFDELSGVGSEDLGHDEGLGEETLDLSGTSDSHLIFFRKIVHTENSDNILEGSVVLEELLDTTSSVVMNLTDNGGIKHTGGGVKGIDSGVDTEFGEGTGKHGSGVEMSEGGGGCGISKIISGHVDGLHRSDRSSLGGGNSLLEGTEIGSESGLISDSGGDTAEEGRHLRASLGESEDVVDEKEHVLVLLISEVLGNGETGKSNTGTGTWGLVHLTVHKCSLGSGAANLDDTRIDHFVVKIVTFTSALTDTGENGETTVSLGDIVNKLHNKHGLADTSTTEKSNLTSLGVWAQKVDNLDTYIIILLKPSWN